jgi:hypothetical protein
MALRVVGAGLGRTGTLSLKLALEKLLGGPCYHMLEVITHPEHVAPWHAAARGEPVEWHALLAGYAAAVDWPASAFWPELADAFPDALVLLSVRDPDAWWESASQTIFPGILRASSRMPDWHAMVVDMFANRFTSAIDDAGASKAAFERHNEDVRKRVPAHRLLEWRAEDGWAPLCEALRLPVPAEPFPRANTRDEFLARLAAATESE